MSEVDEDEAMTGTTVRKLRTAHPDDNLTDDKEEQDLRTIKGVIQGITDETRDEKKSSIEISRSNY